MTERLKGRVLVLLGALILLGYTISTDLDIHASARGC